VIIPFWIIFLFALVNVIIALLAGPIYPLPLGVLVSYFMINFGVRSRLVRFGLVDLIVSTLLLVAAISGLSLTAVLTVGSVSFMKLLILGLIADIVVFGGIFIPKFMDFDIGNIISILVIYTIITVSVGGFSGLFIAVIASLIASIPFGKLFGMIDPELERFDHIPGLITLVLLLLKAVTGVV